MAVLPPNWGLVARSKLLSGAAALCSSGSGPGNVLCCLAPLHVSHQQHLPAVAEQASWAVLVAQPTSGAEPSTSGLVLQALTCLRVTTSCGLHAVTVRGARGSVTCKLERPLLCSSITLHQQTALPILTYLASERLKSLLPPQNPYSAFSKTSCSSVNQNVCFSCPSSTPAKAADTPWAARAQAPGHAASVFWRPTGPADTPHRLATCRAQQGAE